jgi:hypothetical protein
MLISILLCDGQVYIVGHTPPGVDDHESGAAVLNERHNAKYLQVVRLYSDIIRGQFFGHWHSDTFRVIYSDTGYLIDAFHRSNRRNARIDGTARATAAAMTTRDDATSLHFSSDFRAG